MGDIICKWRVASADNLLYLVDALPHEVMPNQEFRDKMGADFMRTPYQLACQLGLYYIDDNDNYIPRFTRSISKAEAEDYLHKWILRYYAPNPYAPSFRKDLTEPIALVPALVEYVEERPGCRFEDACNAIYGEKVGNTDTIMGAINRYSKVLTIDRKHHIVKLLPNYKNILMADRLNKEEFFLAFDADAKKPPLNEPLQQIFFGAPGTGKSHEINKQCCKYEHFRITFHPDTDYASFVGAYKPSTYQEQVVTNMGEKAIPLKDSVTGANVTTTKITYSYVFQAFLKAYVAAWKEQTKETAAPVYLVIEEINRGNCAQIFGDIFQLLDRNESGFSAYPIVADDDLAQELKKVLGDLKVVNADKINGLYEGDHDVVAWVKSGSHLLLPNNLYIWATMNTSDQSLFPIDSAFKRRWDWKYIKIKNSSKSYRIVFSNGNEYDWWEFLMAINAKIEGGDIQQEDKKLGYFFVKAKKDGIISAETLLSKVIFYLYNDVFKDFGLEEDFFKDERGQVMTFPSYFDTNGAVDEARVERFVINVLDLDVSDYSEESAEESGRIQGNDGGRDHTKFRINGKGELVGKSRVAVELVKTYVSQHPGLNASEIIEAWKPFEKFVSHFMESEEEYNQRVNIEGKQPRAEKIDCGGGGVVYVATNGYGTLEKMRKLQELLKETDLGLEISSDKNETAD